MSYSSTDFWLPEKFHSTETTENKNMFEIGDVVCLKSGGPAMTVINYDYSSAVGYMSVPSVSVPCVICIWFNTEHRIEVYSFQEYLIEKINKEEL